MGRIQRRRIANAFAVLTTSSGLPSAHMPIHYNHICVRIALAQCLQHYLLFYERSSIEVILHCSMSRTVNEMTSLIDKMGEARESFLHCWTISVFYQCYCDRGPSRHSCYCYVIVRGLMVFSIIATIIYW